MVKVFCKEVDQLNSKLIALGKEIEDQLENATEAFLTKNEVLAREVIERDNLIDNQEVELEEECLKLLALHQPVAIYLRSIVICIKVNNDLERIGDLAANIAKRAKRFSSIVGVDIPPEIAQLTNKVKLMLKKSLLSLVEGDTKICLLYTSPSPRDATLSRMPSSA